MRVGKPGVYLLGSYEIAKIVRFIASYSGQNRKRERYKGWKVGETDIRINESGCENIWRKNSGLLREPVASLKILVLSFCLWLL